jgi:predicted ATPase
MREAEARIYWKKLEDMGTGPLKEFEYIDVPSLGSGKISFERPIGVLCGLNGAGKSFLLHSIFGCLTHSDGAIPQYMKSRLDGGKMRASLTWRGSEHTINFDLENATWVSEGKQADTISEGLQVDFLDLSELSPFLQNFYRQEANLNEVVEAVEPIRLTTDALKTMSALVGKEYSSLQIFELENFAGRSAVPYIRVESKGRKYGPETMGLGELSAFCLYWFLHRVKKGSILFFEEPESFLSPRSQSFVMDLIVRTCAETQSSAIVTTHSPFVLSKVKNNMAWVVLPTNTGINLKDKANASAHIQFLGVKPRMDFMLLVEDRAASDFLRYILGARSRKISECSEIIWCGSDEDVIRSANGIPPYTKVIKLAAILDGDVRSKKHNSKWPVCYLPGSITPDILFRDVCSTSPNSVARRLGMDNDLLDLALIEVAGLNYHDWIEALCTRLNGVSPDALISAIIGTWLEEEANMQICDEFLDELSEHLLVNSKLY